MIRSNCDQHSHEKLLPKLLSSFLKTLYVRVFYIQSAFCSRSTRDDQIISFTAEKPNLNILISQDNFGLPWGFGRKRQNGLNGRRHTRHTIALVTKLVTKAFSGAGDAMV